jgi:MoaA/NifB/PqqE/SkfB family radical SAM enzyme
MQTVSTLIKRKIKKLMGRSAWSYVDKHVDEKLLKSLRSRQFNRADGISVQLSRRCNLECKMCGWSAWQRNKGYMSLEMFRKVLDEIVACGYKKLSLTNPQGEPLLSPHAAECIDLALNRGLSVTINTNSTTLADRNVEMLVRAAKTGRLAIQASFSGYDKITHEDVYAGSKFENTSAKLRNLITRMKEEGLEDRLTVNGVIYEPDKLEDHFKFIQGLGISRNKINLRQPDNFAGIVDNAPLNAERNIRSFKKDLPQRQLRLCRVLINTMAIYDDGTVTACGCRDSEGVMKIGDLTKQSLKDIQGNDVYQDMLKSFMRRDVSSLSLCRKCDVPYGDKMNETLSSPA